MTDEHRYDEREVAEIFEAATEAQTGSYPRIKQQDGLTLRELHDIAEEVGIPTDLVTRAAHRVGTRQEAVVERWMGVPVGVRRTVELTGPLSDLEWQRLVVILRETFGATGSLEESGALRQWWNGNLRILVEPTATGHRLRMTTTKGDLQALVAMGFSILTIALILFFVGGISGATELAAPLFLGLMGVATLGVALGRMPFWARTRARQMDHLAEEATEMSTPAPIGGAHSGQPDPA